MNSCIEQYDARDYTEELVWSDSKTGKVYKDILYNQKEIWNYTCTTHAACWVFSDITGLKLSKYIIEKIWTMQLKTWAVSNKGDTFINAIRQACKMFNKLFDTTTTFYKKRLLEEHIKSIIDSWSSVMTWYKWKLRADAEDNGVIDNNDHSWNNWHCIRIIKYYYNAKWQFCIKYADNYDWVYDYNIITVEDFNNNKDFFWYWYYLKIENK